MKIFSRNGKRTTSNTQNSNSSIYDIFLSYSHNDKAVALAVYGILTRIYNMKVWFEDVEIVNNDDYAEKILSGIKNSKCVVSILSKSYVKSIKCNELKIGKSFKKRLFLIIIDNIKIEEYAIGYHVIGNKQCDLSQNTNWLNSSLTSRKEFNELIIEILKNIQTQANSIEIE